jgi:hypothetical protein
MTLLPTTIFWDQAKQYQAAVVAVEAGGSYLYNGRTYGTADLQELYLRERLARYRHAEAMVLEGAQSYMMDDIQFSRANMEHLKETIDRLQVVLSRYPSMGGAGGMRVRVATPVGP